MQRLQICKRNFIKDKVIMYEIIIISTIILPILIASTYSLPAADDFFNAYSMKEILRDNNSYIGAVLHRTYEFYRNSGGYTFSFFLNYFFSPYLLVGIKALRIANLFINLFFYVSLYFFIKSTLQNSFEIYNKKLILGVYILVLIAFTNNYNNSETLTWYCVSVAYVLVVTFMLWGIIFFIKAIQNGKKIYAVMASLLGFLVSGGALNVTALNCIIYLTVGILGVVIYKKRKISFICFFSAFIGGIINAISPGNFVRHESISSAYPIFGSLKSAAFLMWSRLQYLLFETPFILLLVIFFILISKHINYDKKKYRLIVSPIFVLVMVIFSIIVVNFPVCLGYSNGTFPDRCIWVEDCCIYLGFFGWTAYFTRWLKEKYKEEIIIQKREAVCIIISGILFFCSLGSVRDLDSYPTI